MRSSLVSKSVRSSSVSLALLALVGVVSSFAAIGCSAAVTQSPHVDPNGATCVDQGQCAPQTLADSGGQSLVASGTKLYWESYSGGIQSVEKHGGKAAQVWSGAFMNGALATDGANVYFSAQGLDASDRSMWGIGRCAIGGCSSPDLVTASTTSFLGLDVDAAQVFAVDSAKLVRAAAEKGASAETLLDGLDLPTAVTLDDAFAYYATWAGTIARLPRNAPGAGGAAVVEVIALGAVHPAALHVDGDDVIWAAGKKPGRIELAPKSGLKGAAPTVLADGLDAPVAIAFDATHIYIADKGVASDPSGNVFNEGRILACPKTGCPASGPVVLATAQHAITAIVADDSGVYWLTAGDSSAKPAESGTVMMVLKTVVTAL